MRTRSVILVISLVGAVACGGDEAPPVAQGALGTQDVLPASRPAPPPPRPCEMVTSAEMAAILGAPVAVRTDEIKVCSWMTTGGAPPRTATINIIKNPNMKQAAIVLQQMATDMKAAEREPGIGDMALWSEPMQQLFARKGTTVFIIATDAAKGSSRRTAAAALGRKVANTIE